jgi:phosphatidylserine/phosphatidylglycerophosphate/cardiolipin synthase-like enzyme
MAPIGVVHRVELRVADHRRSNLLCARHRWRVIQTFPKCLVADRKWALVSSANLTDYALEENMELGLLVGETTAGRLAEHFEQLIARGELVQRSDGA